MRVLVDTPVWSDFFRRVQPNPVIGKRLQGLIESGEALLIGPIRQEVLGGVSDTRHFQRLSASLRAFPDEPLATEDYERAAAMFNQCKKKGIQGSNTDFLICSVAIRLEAPIFTLDRDFSRFQSALPIRLVATSAL